MTLTVVLSELISIATPPASQPGVGLATLTPAMRELVAGGATIITLIGVWLCWRAPRQRMSIEEGAKDRRMTPEQSRRRIQRTRWLGPLVAVAGSALLIVAICI